MSKFWERFFHLLTFITQGASYLIPRPYAIMHRMHHAYSDTEKDPHSPHFFHDIVSMMWETKRIYYDLVHRRVTPMTQFDHGFPQWDSFDRHADSLPMRILWGVVYSSIYFYLITDLWLLILLPVHYLIGPIHGAIVNWCGHKYGYRNFDLPDKSRNTFVWDLLMMGELYQNNHHKNPNRLNFAFRWFEFDPVYPVIKLLGWLRVIRLPFPALSLPG